jgi:hypothetical protein
MGLSGILVFVNFGCAIGIPLSDLQEGVNCRFFVDFGSAIGVRNTADPYRAQV